MFKATTLAKKIALSKTILFVDFDGTVFTPDKKFITAPWYNLQIKRLTQQHNIPFVVVTGRSHWHAKSEIENLLLGLPQPDAVIAGAGTHIAYRFVNGQLGSDKSWEQHMKQTHIQWQEVEKIPWNREVILQMLHCLLPKTVKIIPHKADRYLIRLYVREIPIQQLFRMKQSIEEHFVEGVKVIFTEKLAQKNTAQIFSGNILVVPATAGKENAVKYILHAANKQLPANVPIHAYAFGDATIDVPMLAIKPEPTYFSFESYGVNMTPLAKELLEQKQKERPHLHIIAKPHSPQAILKIVKQVSLSMRERVTVRGKTQTKNNYFSPAQNNLARRLLQPFESFLDTFFDPRLSANDISFKGLDMVKQSIDLIYEKHKPDFFTKLRGLKLYSIGNATDIFDGIRARNTISPSPLSRGIKGEVHEKINLPGQLVDVFCDRAKEFYQLYKRAQKRMGYSPLPLGEGQGEGYQTLLAAISCILPSIARAQAESLGIIVKEQDAKGGSMLDRTKKLFFSFLLDIIGFHNESFRIDQTIYNTNIATYQNRMKQIPSSFSPLFLGEDKGEVVKKENQTPPANERFLLLIQLLQEEHQIIERTLKPYPTVLKKYHEEFATKIKQYLKIDIKNPSSLQLNKYLHFPHDISS